MKAVILTSGIYPGHSPGSKRIGLYKKALLEIGWEVDIIGNDLKSRNLIIFYLMPIIFPVFIVLSRQAHLKTANVILLYGFGWFGALLMLLLCKVRKQKLVLEVNERPGESYGSKFTEFWLIKKMNFLGVHFFSYPLMDGFIVISGALEDYISKFKKDKAKILRVPILIDPAETHLPAEDVKLHQPFIIHSGALSERKDGIITVFKALAIVNNQRGEKLHFYLTSKSAPNEVWSDITQTIEQNNLGGHVHFLGTIAETILRSYQRQCAFVVINKPLNNQNKYNFSTKLGEYLALAKPVVATEVGEMAKFLKDNVNALIVKPDCPEDTARAMTMLLDDPVLAARLGANAKELAMRDFSYKAYAIPLSNFFKSL